ncbi:nicotinamide-nucleotide amidase [Marmoricola sp. OAE513]|uniref:CinA family protein n=1 Tax=Marmoricola sp. OAE513 TaxID=2817894 RepID=UPI001AE3CC3E
MSDREGRQAGEVAELALSRELTLGVAESLTGGRLAAALASAEDAATWFRGGVVAYVPAVKFEVLGVEPGPVNTASCAQQMARGCLDVLGCDLSLAVTGVGGPGPDEGVPAGTVFLAVAGRDAGVEVVERHFEGEPADVVEQTVSAGLELLVRRLGPRAPGT